ncbi:MAG TPA: threonine synthase [Azospirillaceae bacterium]|nr:threonine synthase [Azospirillaceae bacterium]
MRYISTRGMAPALPFLDVLLTGLARDGGLYVPEAWPCLSPADLRALAGRPYDEVAVAVTAPFVGGAIAPDLFRSMVRDAYAGFRHAAVAPLVQTDSSTWLMELFHGPTLAFKDVAMQLLGRLFDHALAQRGERVTIVGATSGDTGAAAMEAFRDRAHLDVFILFPQGRVSEVQRRQMTTVDAPNVHAIAVDGTFDDCQDLVKAMFNDAAFRDELALSAVNSINWARVLAQTVYYVAASLALGGPDRPVRFVVPTGNFGNVYAGHAARAMGIPLDRFVVASNANDILARFLETGAMEVRGVVPTLSPSMDIQISSNAERLLFELMDRDGAALGRWMQDFRRTGRGSLAPAQADAVRATFAGCRTDDAETTRVIAQTYASTGMVVDPHTAVGLSAAARVPGDPAVPTVVLSTAHPAKFPDAVERAIGRRPALPDALSDLYERKERVTLLPNDLGAVQAHVRAHSRFRTASIGGTV